MSAAVSSLAVAPAATGRVAAVRRASRASSFAGADCKRALMSSVHLCRARGAVAMTAASRDPRDSPIVRANGGTAPSREPVADVGRVTAAFARVAQTLWAARKGVFAIAFAVALSLLDPSAAVAGRGGRSGGRMGGSSFRSTSSRSMGGGGFGAAGRGAGAGAAAASATGAGAAAGQRAGYAPAGPRFGLGMPSFFFMPSFGYGYGYGAMGAGYMMMKMMMNLMILFVLYQFLFGGRSGRGGGAGA